MKRLILLLLLCSASVQLDAADPDLKGQLPEEFDWHVYFASEDGSTATSMLQAQAAAAIMKKRIEELCNTHRALLTMRGESAALKLFDEMQEHWEKSANAEIAFVGSSWHGGSGEKAAWPQHRFKVYLRRAKELKELKGDSLFLNE